MSKWKWVLQNDDNTFVKGWSQVGDYWYLLDSNTGVMLTGWQKDSNNNWYYLDPTTGQLKTGWIQLDNKWYYLEEESNGNKGVAYKSGTFTIDGKEYQFNDDCAMQDSSTSLVSDDCISFVKGYEKFYSYKYDDGTGTITQGYGAVGSEIANWGDAITEAEASEELETVINSNYAQPLKDYLDSVGVSLSQCQFDSLVSCAYNIGVSSLEGSSLIKYIVSGGRDADTITTDFCMWDKVIQNDVAIVWDGLHKRRVAESNIFNNGVYDSSH